MRRPGFVLAATCCGVLVWPAPLLAGEPEVAEQLFRDGHALLKEQRYSEACPKFAESQLHDPASGTLLALAYCQELAGWIASARSSYVAAAELARKENQLERERAATERAASLEPRLSTLSFSIPPALLQLPSLRVSDNGVELSRDELQKPLAVDGGLHTITVLAKGRAPWSQQVSVQPERDHRVVSVPDSPPAPAPASAAALGAPASRWTESAPRYWTTRRTLGWSAVGLGAASGALSAYFAVAAKSAQSDVEAQIRSDEQQTSPTGTRIPWDASGHAREVDGKRDAALAQGFGIASGALLLGGAALVIFGSEAHEHTPANLSLAITPAAARLGYSGSF